MGEGIDFINMCNLKKIVLFLGKCFEFNVGQIYIIFWLIILPNFSSSNHTYDLTTKLEVLPQIVLYARHFFEIFVYEPKIKPKTTTGCGVEKAGAWPEKSKIFAKSPDVESHAIGKIFFFFKSTQKNFENVLYKSKINI